MNIALPDSLSLRDLIRGSAASGASLNAVEGSVRFNDILRGTLFDGRLRELYGRSVLVAVKAHLAAALALVELDGVAARLVVCPPDFAPDRLESVIRQAQVDAIVGDAKNPDGAGPQRFVCAPLAPGETTDAGPRLATEWVLPTSGTTGAPKLVAHSRQGLLGAANKAPARERPIVWGTFYDIRRYGGLQILLRALTGGATLVLSEAGEPLADYLLRCRDAGVTHISGTPSHWRRLLMSPHVRGLSPLYVRLSGEIADRAILDSLRAAYPDAAIAHAYASTEAGVAFEVADGLEGFPASLVDAGGEVALRVEDGSLRIRSARTATRYIGRDDLALLDAHGFVDTEDMVERRGERYYFQGRRSGVINIGGLKVHPEEVERIINLHPDVRMSLVRGRRNPLMGNIVVADVVLRQTDQADSGERRAALGAEILAACRERLERHQVPAVIDFVASLELVGSGKLARGHA